tara:strand:- start:4294 stop:4551 length:258 start_codon:yes stop_codon:yes gene_type:complete
MLNIVKQNYPNIYIIFISMAVAIWFNGCNMLIEHYFSKTLNNGILLCTISLLILYMDDGKINELHNTDDKNASRNAAAILSAGYD